MPCDARKDEAPSPKEGTHPQMTLLLSSQNISIVDCSLRESGAALFYFFSDQQRRLWWNSSCLEAKFSIVYRYNEVSDSAIIVI